MSVRAALILSCLLCAAGCASPGFMQPISRSFKRIYTPRPYDQRNTTEEEGDAWAGVADPIRKDQPRETDPDSWWKKYIMSEKARGIEENLGVD